jgi:hypothetical protein
MFIPPWPSYQPDTISLEKSLSRQFITANNAERYLGFHPKCPTVLPNLTKFGFSQQTFIEVPNIKFLRNPSTGCCTDKYGQTARRTDGHDVAKPKKGYFIYKDFLLIEANDSI